MVLGIIIFIVIHLLELAGYLIYAQNKKNQQLITLISEQELYISKISEVVKLSKDKLEELDAIGAFRSDDELGVFFNNLKVIQGILNEFIAQKGKN